MADPEHVEVVKRGREAIYEWRGAHPGERFDLSGADLTEANLRRTKLEGAYLYGVDFYGADFSEAIFIPGWVIIRRRSEMGDHTPFELQERLHRESTIAWRLQGLIGSCMSLGEDLHKEDYLIEEGFVEAARMLLAKAAARLEAPLNFVEGTPLEVKE